MDTVTHAVKFAADSFDGQRRKCSLQPAVLHGIEAGTIASTMTDDNEVIAAAILHDVLEDTPVTKEEMEIAFGTRITNLVLAETENKYRSLPAENTWRRRKEEAISNLKSTNDVCVRIIYLSDKLSNMRSLYNDMILQGDIIWQQFNQKDPKQHYWYYSQIAEILVDLNEYPAWQEYVRLINLVFKKEGENRE